MLVGIDVGGTFTDGVLLAEGEVINSVKQPTDEENLKESILAVLDELIKGTDPTRIKRVVLSTTLVTNLLATGKGERTALVLIPGPGLNLQHLDLAPNSYTVEGAVDFRGRVISSIKRTQVAEVGKDIAGHGIRKVAVVGKFSQRNNSLEAEAREILMEQYPHFEVFLGSEVSGQLNFLRRAVTTYYTAMTRSTWDRFAREIQEALVQRGIGTGCDILKADGGTMPLEVSVKYPCETVFSGPAASAMGAYALTMDKRTSVVVDIGGTTSDLALILEGKPLYASKGAVIDGKYTHVRAFAVRSVALGGDSTVRWNGSEVVIGPDREGVAACFGGPRATPTDAFNLLEGGKLGRLDLSQAALERVAGEARLPVEELARQVVEKVVELLETNVKDMFKSWEQEPAYRVWEIVNRRKVSLDRAIGIGAAAEAFIPTLARRLGCEAFIHRYSPVANALGAGVARPTLSIVLHADTQRQTYSLDIGGVSGTIGSRVQLEDVKKLAREHLEQLANDRGIGHYARQSEFFLEEQFNVIRGWSTVGKLFDVGIQIAPGVIDEFKGVK
ncbi:hydantoinase/oxoprolinase family protein [Syntrophothermus lipocalidus]|uniref:Hydantoinase/oxoprolinase n=1 Tax=Syntrophothermus lipocalidus (strain DSM 12680 / TGB-C1) TaxID=643648 RepID=D7CMB7_SYNLT|nr:hydantoinase/oxoprolinase family protein [Syntrophothermus lipocalidus]ADI01852.1 Hydantoinase/oxoprolinase [Syntrophothermus lipocalidus DSM 12680]